MCPHSGSRSLAQAAAPSLRPSHALGTPWTPVVHRAHAEPPLECMPTLFHTHRLLVAERKVFGCRRIVVRCDHPLAVELFLLAHGGLVDDKTLVPFSQVLTEPTTRLECTLSFAMAVLRGLQCCKLALQLFEQLATVPALSLFFVLLGCDTQRTFVVVRPHLPRLA